MLYHHDSRDYNEAASAAAKHARGKLEAIIEKGRATAQAVLDKIDREVPTDIVAGGKAIQFVANDDVGDVQVVAKGKEPWAIHKNAMRQVVERAGMKMDYVDYLQSKGDWGRELAARNLNELYHHNEDKFLLRGYKEELRGFLSNKFRRLDSRPIIESFAKACQGIGAVPYEGVGTDTRVSLRALLPVILEPVPNEVMCVGVAWQNSDYGNGAHSLRMFALRLWCTNLAITEECLREVHLGTHLGDDDVFSARTYELDTKRSASMVLDAVKGGLSPTPVKRLCAAIKEANEEKVDPKTIGNYLKKKVGAGDAKRIVDTFASAEIEMLPPGQSKWRLSNAISWIANKETDKEKAMDLQRLAGEVLA
jgi:hypothetical protein